MARHLQAHPFVGIIISEVRDHSLFHSLAGDGHGLRLQCRATGGVRAAQLLTSMFSSTVKNWPGTKGMSAPEDGQPQRDGLGRLAHQPDDLQGTGGQRRVPRDFCAWDATSSAVDTARADTGQSSSNRAVWLHPTLQKARKPGCELTQEASGLLRGGRRDWSHAGGLLLHQRT